MSKIAILSNVNVDYVIRLLQGQCEICENTGYGNELGVMLNPLSDYHAYNPDITVVVMDLMELIQHNIDKNNVRQKVEEWFASLEISLKDDRTYFISDAYLWGIETRVFIDADLKTSLEMIWQESLNSICAMHKNVYIFPYRVLIENIGEENAFSWKTWYMGHIPFTNGFQKKISENIIEIIHAESANLKKVLLLDLDNTLWGGLAGEHDHTPILLSEDGKGLVFKNLQRVILQMQKQGIILGIVSKNNESDAMEIIDNHPHMILRGQCFAARRINWHSKYENILDIASELNLGLDSFVFFDDSPMEREEIRKMLPEVMVVDFPEQTEKLPEKMVEIYKSYFKKNAITEEDQKKTEQYTANAKRNALKEQSINFEEYLKQLDIEIVAVNPQKSVERLTQLLNKTNQFNLTTKRYTRNEIEDILSEQSKQIFIFRVTDKFGDNGIVAAMIVDCSDKIPVIDEFVMSCRVMGREIEQALVDFVEHKIYSSGYTKLRALFVQSEKNNPVKDLYDKLGYTLIQDKAGEEKIYERDLTEDIKRIYFAKIKEQETI